MIQQSQLLTKTMFLEPDQPNLLNSPLLDEPHKMALSPYSEQQSKAVTVPLSKKPTKKPTSKDSPKPKKSRTTEEGNSNQKFGHWTLEQNKRYHWFLEIHNKHFFNKHMRRTDKIFKTMALFVGTREAEQCRSHHQKMEKKHRNIRTILISLRLEHYAAKTEDNLIQDLQANKIDIVDPILSSRFLENSHENSIASGANAESDKISEQSYQQRKQQVAEQQVQQWVVEQQRKQEEEQIRLLPIRMDCFEMDMVDLLLGEQAPHNNYLMI